MATRTHIKLCDIEGRFYMNILFVSVCVDSVTAAKLYVSGFIFFWACHVDLEMLLAVDLLLVSVLELIRPPSHQPGHQR